MTKPVDKVNRPDKPLGSASDDDVMELIHDVMHRHRTQQFQALRSGPHAVTHMDAKVLGFFGRHPGATPSDLVRHSGRDKSQLARLIKGLRERGLLASVADSADRRQLRLWLTADGDSLQRTLRRQARRLGNEAVAGLSADERQQLAALLRRLRDNLGAASVPAPPLPERSIDPPKPAPRATVAP